jgi:hypothetical protein
MDDIEVLPPKEVYQFLLREDAIGIHILEEVLT